MKIDKRWSKAVQLAVTILLSGLAIAGCKGPPLEEIAAAEAAIQKARDGGAPQFAPQTFAAAETALQQAYAENDKKNYDLARARAISARELAEAALREALKKAEEERKAAATGGPEGKGGLGTGVDETTGDESLTGVGVETSALPVIFFDFDDYAIRSDQRSAMDKATAFLLEHGNLRIRLEGHTDERGEAEYNLALGRRRALAVKDDLVAGGVAAARIETVSLGEEDPSDSEHTREAWSANRRVKFILLRANE